MFKKEKSHDIETLSIDRLSNKEYLNIHQQLAPDPY